MGASCIPATNNGVAEIMQKLKFYPPDHITDNLYVGSLNSAVDLTYLEEKRIGRVVCAAGQQGKKFFPD